MDFSDEAAYVEINQCRAVLNRRRYTKILQNEEQILWQRIRQRVILMLVRHAEYSLCRGYQFPRRLDRMEMNEDEYIVAELYMPFVFGIARKAWRPAISFLDLFQEGMIGLMRAMRRYDYQRGVKFTTFAMIWVRQEIWRYSNNHSRTIRVPTHILQRARRQWRGEEETFFEIPRIVPSSDSAQDDEEEWETGSDDFFTNSSEDTFFEKQRHWYLHALVEALGNPRDREIIMLRYFNGNDERTLEEIGSRYGITRARIQQIEKRILKIFGKDEKLKEFFDAR